MTVQTICARSSASRPPKQVSRLFSNPDFSGHNMEPGGHYDGLSVHFSIFSAGLL